MLDTIEVGSLAWSRRGKFVVAHRGIDRLQHLHRDGKGRAAVLVREAEKCDRGDCEMGAVYRCGG